MVADDSHPTLALAGQGTSGSELLVNRLPVSIYGTCRMWDRCHIIFETEHTTVFLVCQPCFVLALVAAHLGACVALFALDHRLRRMVQLSCTMDCSHLFDC